MACFYLLMELETIGQNYVHDAFTQGRASQEGRQNANHAIQRRSEAGSLLHQEAISKVPHQPRQHHSVL